MILSLNPCCRLRHVNGLCALLCDSVSMGMPRSTKLSRARSTACGDLQPIMLMHRYSELKRTLATEHTTDREAYTAGKARFARSVLDEQPSPDQR